MTKQNPVNFNSSAIRRLWLCRVPRQHNLLVVAVIPLLLIAGCRPAPDGDLLRKFQAAQEAFDKASRPEEFVKVAAMYQEILDSGVVSGAVLYNQGNALVRARQPGRAIAAYRLAQRYRPRDPDLDANLRSAQGADASAAGRRPLVEMLLFWQNWLSYPEKFYAAASVAILAFALSLLALLTRRRLRKRMTLVAVMLLGVLCFSAAYDWYRFDCIVHGVIARPKVVARKGNAASYEPAFTEPLTEGTEFRLRERRADWLLIELAGGEEGWIEQDDAALCSLPNSSS
jgi:hypothetical protein